MNHVSTNATSTTNVATVKTSCSASVNAAACGTCAPSSSLSLAEKIAPSTAVPSDPPIERNSVAPEVATPSCSYETAFWVASTSTCMTMPRPRPSTSMWKAATPVPVVSSSDDRSHIPSAAIAVPAIGNAL